MNHADADKRRILLAAFFAIPIAGASIDIYTPSLPGISQYFQISNARAQFSVTLFLLGFGLSQLISGSVSDAFGRRKSWRPLRIRLSCFYWQG
jgi:DHA1 family bicyclomycin/chloramphenicol resistance-like MFS transporter